jgi:hypothetical protein
MEDKKMAKKILAITLALLILLPFAVACNSDVDVTIDINTPTSGTSGTTATTGNNNNNNNGGNTGNENNGGNEGGNGGNTTPEEPPVFEEDPFKDGKLSIKGNDISEYVIVTPVDPVNSVKYFAEDFADWVKDITGKEIAIVEDTAAPVAKEILIGNTNRPESTQAKASISTEQKSYNGLVTDSGKVAIVFNHKNGSVSALNALQRSFANNKCNVSESFTNTKIELENIKDLVMGAIRKDIEADGLHVHKCTQAQIDAWHAHTASWNGNKENPRSSLGVRIDIDTDSS